MQKEKNFHAFSFLGTFGQIDVNETFSREAEFFLDVQTPQRLALRRKSAEDFFGRMCYTGKTQVDQPKSIQLPLFCCTGHGGRAFYRSFSYAGGSKQWKENIYAGRTEQFSIHQKSDR